MSTPREPVTDDVVVREAKGEDAAVLARLSGVLGYPVDADEFERRLVRCLAAREQAVWVAERREAIVGWIHVADRELLDSGRHCEILALIVDPGRRRAGIGQRLVEAVERWSTGRGVARLVVRSNVVRAESHPFYARVGFARTKTQHVYRKDL
jgi:GNAT superfamily N-acetyltransferase